MRETKSSLRQFADFVLKARLVRENAAPYVVRWVRLFLQTPASEGPLDDRARRCREGPVRQAEHAMRLSFVHGLQRRDWHQPPHPPPTDGPGVVAPLAVLEPFRRALRTRHDAYRTEVSYIDWVTRFFASLSRATTGLAPARRRRGGLPGVWLPDALERKYPHASRERGWFWGCPSATLSTDARTGRVRRHHLSASVAQKAVKAAAARAKIRTPVSVPTLRHCFATHLLLNSVDIRQIQEYLGHAHVETTRIETHVVKELRSPVSRDLVRRRTRSTSAAIRTVSSQEMPS